MPSKQHTVNSRYQQYLDNPNAETRNDFLDECINFLYRSIIIDIGGGKTEFIFDISREQGREHEQNMLHVSMPAATLFKSLREVRNMIHQQRETNKQFQGALNDRSNSAVAAVR